MKDTQNYVEITLEKQTVDMIMKVRGLTDISELTDEIIIEELQKACTSFKKLEK